MSSSRSNGHQVSPGTQPGPAGSSSPAEQAQAGEYLTTAQGLRLPDTDHSLKAGDRGPTLLEDFHLREKITHFDHERIPERVVHARGAAAHGVFESYGTAASVTKAGFLGKKGRQTEVFVRFSTVLGSRGSADTVRDTRGFAVKFYTDEGTFDLVGNNIPVFFIQDGIKFPDVIHAAKPHPDREIPQAQTAHDTFWDFVSLHTEATHHVMWNMSDRGIPRSYRTMEGFGVHTFRLVNADGETSLVKFHWKPRRRRAFPGLGGGADRRRGATPTSTAATWPTASRRARSSSTSSGMQVMPDDGTRHVRGHRPARPDQARPRGAGAGSAGRQADAEPQPDELLRRDRAGRLPHRQPRAGHRGHQRPADAGPAVLLPRHPAHPPGRPELHPAADQPAALPGQRHAARRHAPDRDPHRRRPLPAQQPRRRPAAGRRRAPTAATSRSLGRSRERGPGATRSRSTTISPRRRCSTAA